jgi:hypothetical protein
MNYSNLIEKSICLKCAGCNRLLNPRFKGLLICDYCTEDNDNEGYGSMTGDNN